MKGGVGKTSTTANLAAMIAKNRSGMRVFMLDLDPQNSLKLHFGFGGLLHDGVCRQSLQNRDWVDVMFESLSGPICMPYGVVSEPERKAFERLLEKQPDWVGRQLARAGIGAGDLVLIDTPPGRSVYLEQAFACADLAMIMLLADAGSYATIPAMELWLDEIQVSRPDLTGIYLLNQLDDARPLSRDIGSVLGQNLGHRLAPGGIHRDEAISEALACQQPVLHYDPHCQATADIRRVASWLLASLNQSRHR